MANEHETEVPTDEEVEELLNPDDFSGRERKAFEVMDRKNVDRTTFKSSILRFISAYKNAKSDA